MLPTDGLVIDMDRLIMFSTNTSSIQEVLFFLQMRPEKAAPAYELTDDEKIILSILEKHENKLSLSTLKEQAA